MSDFWPANHRACGILEAMNGGRKRQHGFTVVEVLIVLAVTGALFLSATTLISGRQAQTAFDQGIRQIQSQIQQAISDVSNGYYPSRNSIQCAAGAGGPVITPGSSGQGSNAGCVFIGKVMQFDVQNSAPEQFIAYSLAGLQQNSAGNDVSSLAEAKPLVIAPSSGAPTTPDETTAARLENGLTTYSMKANGLNIGAVGFVSTLAQFNGALLSSGSQQVQLVAVPGTSLNATELATAQQINSVMASLPAADVNPLGGVQICFVSGTTNQSGLITIGANNSTLSVTLAVKGNKTCS